MDKINEKLLENPKDLTITYNDKEVKIGELTDDEKIDCISQLWFYKEHAEYENASLKDMVQKMYLFGKMENIQEEKND
jgi:hypothetical protein